MTKMILWILGIQLLLAVGLGFPYDDSHLYEGSKCKNDDINGICTRQPDCNQAVQEAKLNGHHNLQRCGFNGSIEIVCCPTVSARIKTGKIIQICDDYESQLPKLTNNFSTNISFVPIFVDSPKKKSFSPYVINGVFVDKDEYPHVVALGFYNNDKQAYSFDCGGTLISNKYVITAAHCIVNIENNELKVIRMGSILVPSDPIREVDPYLDHKPKRVILHPNYNRSRSIHDIALVELEKEIEFRPNIRPACLYTEEEEPSEMQVAGWGAVNITGARTEVLQKANVSSVPLERCALSLRSKRRSIGQTHICAQDVKSDTCEGDSGGPLQIENNRLYTLVGITSYGAQCFGGLPGVYTKISAYLDWIEETVWP